MPGSGKQTPQVQQQIKELLEAGFDPTTIHRRLKVGRSSVYRMKRCLQQHGTNYIPPELNKKNGRPKVLTPVQELEVREWLRDPKNRTRYLDDLVWLIHDRFGIVCSTTTMSKMKRKWLRVIEYEETGNPLDELTRAQLYETHPTLPELLQQPPLPLPPPPDDTALPTTDLHMQLPLPSNPYSLPHHHEPDLSDIHIAAAAAAAIGNPDHDVLLDPPDSHHHEPNPKPSSLSSHQFDPDLTSPQSPPQAPGDASSHHANLFDPSQHPPLTDPDLLSPQIDTRLEQRLQNEITAAAAAAAAAAAVNEEEQRQQDQPHFA